MAGVRKWERLVPVTSHKPIKLTEYIAQEARSRVVDQDRLTDEWIAWYDARKDRV
jgi:hypothetical protein